MASFLQFVLQLFVFHFVCKIRGHSAKLHPLLVVAFDGFRWDYLKKTETPHFDKFIKEGVHAREGIKNVFETETLPNLWTLATGLYPESHGVVSNEMFDPVLNETYVPFFDPLRPRYPNNRRFFDFGAEPIWVTNQRQKSHAKSGIVMWPGGRYFVKWSRPSFYMPYDQSTGPMKRADTVLKWFTEEDPPINLGMVYLDNPDLIAHKYGPNSDQVKKYIAKADGVVGHILEELKTKGLIDEMNIIITSDHGFTSVSRSKIINLDDIIPRGWYSRILEHSPVLSLIPNPGMEDKLYNELKEASIKPNSHFRVWKKKDIPERFHYKNNIRVAPIVALADLQYSFLINSSIDEFEIAGTHGYDNELQDMHPIFFAKGPSFKKDFAVKTFDSVDVYPLMCQLLHLEPAPNNGSMHIISELLSNNEETMWTFATYIFVLIFISSVGGIFTVAACRQHRHFKRKMFQNRQMSFQGGIRYSVPAKGNAVVKLLSDDDDDEDYDDYENDNGHKEKTPRISH